MSPWTVTDFYLTRNLPQWSSKSTKVLAEAVVWGLGWITHRHAPALPSQVPSPFRSLWPTAQLQNQALESSLNYRHQGFIPGSGRFMEAVLSHHLQDDVFIDLHS